MFHVDVSSMQVYLPQSTSVFRTSLTEPFDLNWSKALNSSVVLKFRPLDLDYYSEISFESNKITLFVGRFGTSLRLAKRSESLFNPIHKNLDYQLICRTVNWPQRNWKLTFRAIAFVRGLWWRAISLQWPINIVNSVEKSKFLCFTSPLKLHCSLFRN